MNIGTGPDGPTLLGVDSGAVRTESRVEPPPNRGWWLGIGGLLVAVIVGWSLVSGGPANDVADPATTTSPSTTAATTTRPVTMTRRSTTSSPNDTPGGATVRFEVTEFGSGPLLGEETGLWLLVATGGKLGALDLDAGLRYDLGLSVDMVHFVSGRWLLGTGGNGSFALELDTLERADFGELFVTADPAPEGQAWFSGYEEEAGHQSLRLLDLATGEELDRIVIPKNWASYWGVTPRLTIGSPRSGGVFHLSPDGATRLADGAAIGVAGDRILVERCDDSLACDLAWIDGGGRPVDDWLVPERPLDLVHGLGGTDWVAVERWSASYELSLFDPADGRTIDLPGQGWAQGLAASPDGRWLFNSDGRVLVFDLETGAEVEIDGHLFGSTAVWLDGPPGALAAVMEANAGASTESGG